MNIECLPALYTSLFGSLAFTGLIFSSIILVLTSKYGRRINTVAGAWITVPLMAGIIFIPILYTRYVLTLVIGLTFFKSVQAYVLGTELIQSKHKVYFTTATLSSIALMIPLVALYFRFISNDWKYLFYGFLIVTFIIAVLSMLLPESPKFLHEKEKYEEARKVIIQMAKMNGAKDMAEGNWAFEGENIEKVNNIYAINDSLSDSILSQSLREIEQSGNEQNGEESIQTKANPFKMIKSHPNLCTNLLIIMVSWMSTSFNENLLGFSIRNFGGNLYYNVLAFGFCSILGKCLSVFVRKMFNSKISLFIMLLIVLMFGISLIFIENTYLMAICIGGVQIGIGGSYMLLYFINTEYFPPLFAPFAFAI